MPRDYGEHMNVSEAIQNRWSVRAYKDAPVAEKDLLLLLEAARLSPSARNRQHRKYVVTHPGPALVDACNGQSWIGTAPIAIVGIVDPSVASPWDVADLSIAFDHMVLQATELGLGTCWIGAFDESKVKDLFAIPEDKKVVAILTVGYPDTAGSHKKKDPLDAIWTWDTYAW